MVAFVVVASAVNWAHLSSAYSKRHEYLIKFLGSCETDVAATLEVAADVASARWSFWEDGSLVLTPLMICNGFVFVFGDWTERMA